MIESYSTIYNLGHAAITDLLKEQVIIEEKVDGSQISMRKTDAGELQLRSKGAQINLVAPEGMFQRAVETLNEIAPLMRPGFTYRGEYLSKPHHNVITYSRVPSNHIIIFDVSHGAESYHTPEQKREFAAELGLECVPVLFSGTITSPDQLRALLDKESVLGGAKIEGVVIKPSRYNLFGRDKKVLMGKFVSEAFKEVHNKTWSAEHKTPGPQDVLQVLGSNYGTAARWAKAVIHLKERGQLSGDLKDIGALIKEVPEDVLRECEQHIKDELFKWAWPQLRRLITRGLPEWYKEQLVKQQFNQN